MIELEATRGDFYEPVVRPIKVFRRQDGEEPNELLYDHESQSYPDDGSLSPLLVCSNGASSGILDSDSEEERQREIEQLPSHSGEGDLSEEQLWEIIKEEARADAESEPVLASFLHSTILSHRNLYEALCFRLSNKLASPTLVPTQLMAIFTDVFGKDLWVRKAVRCDLLAFKQRDPACRGYSQPLLYFKGYQAIQSYRVAHSLWSDGRKALALALQSLISDVFHVDIHPAARIGMGLLVDHAIGVVIGETAVIGDDCSILHNVTLGGTGKETGDRHPKVGNGVLLGAHVTVLGNLTIGNFAKIGAGSVVLSSIPCHTTAVGVPAKVVGKTKFPPSLTMNHNALSVDCPSLNMDHVSGFVLDYQI